VTYSDADPPYRTANVMITSPSELMAVSGFDRETFAKVAPYVTVLPSGTKLNVNTASDVVLASLSDDIDISTAQSLIEQRDGAEFLDIDKTFEDLVEPDVLKRIDGVTEHFLLTATVTLGTNQMTMRSILQRDPSGLTRALFRTLGVE
jgi:general secretion pathway protein K